MVSGQTVATPRRTLQENFESAGLGMTWKFGHMPIRLTQPSMPMVRPVTPMALTLTLIGTAIPFPSRKLSSLPMPFGLLKATGPTYPVVTETLTTAGIVTLTVTRIRQSQVSHARASMFEQDMQTDSTLFTVTGTPNSTSGTARVRAIGPFRLVNDLDSTLTGFNGAWNLDRMFW